MASPGKKNANKPRLDQREVKLLKALVAGKTNGEAGMIATGSTNLHSGAVATNRMLKRASLRKELDEAFKKHGLTVDAAIKPVGEALKHEDIEYRLKGSDRATKLLGLIDREQQGNTFNFNFGAKSNASEYIDNE